MRDMDVQDFRDIPDDSSTSILVYSYDFETLSFTLPNSLSSAQSIGARLLPSDYAYVERVPM
jgi:hypothetical protein